jgi:uncharacterized protein (DUF1800 family)
MMRMLDTVRNLKAIPNENYARELLELFTLGVFDLDGNPNYVQDDIVQIARAFTGWTHTNSGKPYLYADEHDFAADFPARGPKRIFTQSGGFGPGGRDFDDQGEGEIEIDRVVDHVFDHRDGDGEVTVARRLAARLLEFFCHGGFADPATAKPVATAVVSASGFDTTWSISDLVREILVHDAFYETTGSTQKSLSWPVDYIVSTLRLLGMKPKGRYAVIPSHSYLPIWDHSSNMGQSLLQPPSVFGWDWEESWVTSATLLARFEFARDVTTARYGSGSFEPGQLIDLGMTDGGDIVDAVVDACGVTGLYSPAERDALIDYVTGGDPDAPVDLFDYDVRNEKLHGLFALVLQSPAYQLR